MHAAMSLRERAQMLENGLKCGNQVIREQYARIAELKAALEPFTRSAGDSAAVEHARAILAAPSRKGIVSV